MIIPERKTRKGAKKNGKKEKEAKNEKPMKKASKKVVEKVVVETRAKNNKRWSFGNSIELVRNNVF